MIIIREILSIDKSWFFKERNNAFTSVNGDRNKLMTNTEKQIIQKNKIPM